jgi:hypothetical protein
MPIKVINGQTYEEVAVIASPDAPLPVDIGGATVDVSGSITIGNVTVDNANGNPVPVSDAGGLLSVDDGGGSITVDGPLTDAQLRAIAVPVSASALPLPTGAATGANQSTANSSLSAINGKLPALASGRVPVDGSGVTQPVSDGGGSITVDSAAGALSVTGPLTDAQLRNSPVPIGDGGGSITVDGVVSINGDVSVVAPARTPTTTSVASQSTSQLILAQNANRKGLSISNISSAKLYLSFSNPATLGNCFLELQPGTFLLLDQQLIVANAIYGFWGFATGQAQVTEFV